jgi:agmatinase
MSDFGFDPGGVGVHNGNYFGFPWSAEEAEVVLLNVPWDATTSYRRGTAQGPAAMIVASTQLDFYSFDNPGAPLVRCGTDRSIEQAVLELNDKASPLSARLIAMLEEGLSGESEEAKTLASSVNRYSVGVEFLVAERSKYWIDHGKLVLLVGGEHSVPLGFMKSLSARYPQYGILQIDAHADLRESYEGFAQSHAGIMYNALQAGFVQKLVQVGVRDVSTVEMTLSDADCRIVTYPEHRINAHLYAGGSWFEHCREIVAYLPENVYVSFDIDGLSPLYCPNTGTPVPGNLTPDMIFYLLRMVVESGRRIIGADLCEVAPGDDEWDASVGARILYRLAVLMRHGIQPTSV